MKDGMKFVDCDMHINEPADLFVEWLDPKFKDRVLTPVDAKGKPKRGMWIVDGLPSSADSLWMADIRPRKHHMKS